MTPPRIYVAGPLTHGGVDANVANAIDAGQRLLVAGAHPFVPHLHMQWERVHPNDYEVWMGLVMGWLRCCDAIVRLPGHSPGSDREVVLGGEIGIQVFYSVDAALDWIANR
jgi:hypothetical protein